MLKVIDSIEALGMRRMMASGDEIHVSTKSLTSFIMTGRFVYRYFYHDILVQSTVAVVRISGYHIAAP